jgi:hypothetical protein
MKKPVLYEKSAPAIPKPALQNKKLMRTLLLKLEARICPSGPRYEIKPGSCRG